MKIAAIDPGPTQSALVVGLLDKGVGHLPEIVNARFIANDTLLAALNVHHWDLVLIERIAPYGQPIGWETVQTIEWLSKFELRAGRGYARLITRQQVKLALFGTTQRITDSAIRDEIIHRYGGKEKAIGKKANPGPLYGLKADLWQAFALIIAWPDLK